MNYKAVKRNNKFDVIETMTNHVLLKDTCRSKAYAVANSYNKGKAFNGWTPAFMLREFINSRPQPNELEKDADIQGILN